ncbi:hypothetical protein LAUMK41_04603 [Mycobacterium attenuatum]|nr:hypothetical protein LAUMK41_04603 [Mycobacterium attenuatum]
MRRRKGQESAGEPLNPVEQLSAVHNLGGRCRHVHQIVEPIPRGDMVCGILTRSGLDDTYRAGDALQQPGNLFGMLTARLILVSDNDDGLAAQRFPVELVGTARAHR